MFAKEQPYRNKSAKKTLAQLKSAEGKKVGI